MFDFECTLDGNAEEERKQRTVRYRTPATILSGSGAGRRVKNRMAARSHGRPPSRFSGKPADRRIQRTRAILHEALGSLIREKAYDRITVAQILDRAKVSRSTFYTHFRDKDDLLMSSMRALLLGSLSAGGGAVPDTAERMLAFSLPLLTHIREHLHSAKTRLGERGRAVLHEHLRLVLSEWILQTLDGSRGAPMPRPTRSPIAPELLARHIASTFVLVLHWWLDHAGNTSPVEADKLFRGLVMPVLRPAPV